MYIFTLVRLYLLLSMFYLNSMSILSWSRVKELDHRLLILGFEPCPISGTPVITCHTLFMSQ